jgi:hypothetical protein
MGVIVSSHGPNLKRSLPRPPQHSEVTDQNLDAPAEPKTRPMESGKISPPLLLDGRINRFSVIFTEESPGLAEKYRRLMCSIFAESAFLNHK